MGRTEGRFTEERPREEMGEMKRANARGQRAEGRRGMADGQ
jgi:hypothetical protein